jgi:TonB family protein
MAPPQPLPSKSDKAGDEGLNLKMMGSLDKEVIRAGIGSHRTEIADCYEAALTLHPTLEGKVVVKFIINQEGAVVSSEVVESTVRNEGMESCIVKNVRSWRFPKPKGGGVVAVTYPFIFRQPPIDAEERP